MKTEARLPPSGDQPQTRASSGAHCLDESAAMEFLQVLFRQLAGCVLDAILRTPLGRDWARDFSRRLDPAVPGQPGVRAPRSQASNRSRTWRRNGRPWAYRARERIAWHTPGLLRGDPTRI